MLAIADMGLGIYLWNINQGSYQLIPAWREMSWISDLRFNPDGTILSLGGLNTTGQGVISLWRLSDQSLDRVFIHPQTLPRSESDLILQRHNAALVRSVAPADHGKWWFSANVGGDVYVWESASGKLLQQLPASKTAIYALDVTPSSEHLALAGADGSVYLWQLPK
ncbi:MAG: hypothetical protein R2865_12435 [Deinococcales bacterium]